MAVPSEPVSFRLRHVGTPTHCKLALSSRQVGTEYHNVGRASSVPSVKETEPDRKAETLEEFESSFSYGARSDLG